MYIDDCRHTFEQLAQNVLPAYMEQLKLAIEQPFEARIFCVPGRGRAAIASQVGRTGDFSGCYVLLETDRPIYVGISRSVLGRLRQHFTGKTHFDASLAYAVAQRNLPTKGHRSRVMEREDFQQAFADARQYLQGLMVAFIEIENPLELYLFEAYAAMSLRTFDWNTFRTH